MVKKKDSGSIRLIFNTPTPKPENLMARGVPMVSKGWWIFKQWYLDHDNYVFTKRGLYPDDYSLTLYWEKK